MYSHRVNGSPSVTNWKQLSCQIVPILQAKVLCLYGCAYLSINEHRVPWHILTDQCHELTKISIQSCDNVGDDFVSSLGVVTRLKRICVKGCRLVQQPTRVGPLFCIIPTPLYKLQCGLPHTETLNYGLIHANSTLFLKPGVQLFASRTSLLHVYKDAFYLYMSIKASNGPHCTNDHRCCAGVVFRIS